MRKYTSDWADKLSSPKVRLVQHWSLNLVAILLASIWLILIWQTLTPDIDDFKQYWQAAVDLRQTGDPYASTPAWNDTTTSHHRLRSTITYPYPPLLAYLLQPFGRLSQQQGQFLWFGVNVILLFILIGACIHASNFVQVRHYWGVLVLGMVIAPPTRLSLQLGQVSIMLALLVVTGFISTRRSTFFAGLMLCLASMIKLYPAFLGIYYFLRRPHSVLWWSTATGIIILALSLVVYGVEPYISYVRKVLLSGFYPYAAEFNISLIGFWDRLLSESRYAQSLIDSSIIARIIAMLMIVGVLSICIQVGSRPKNSHSEPLSFSVWICGMMLISPINGYYNLILLLLPLLTVLHYLKQHPDRQTRNWLIVGTALCCIPPGWSNIHPVMYNTVHVGWGLLLLTPSLYGLGIYFGLLTVLARRHIKPKML